MCSPFCSHLPKHCLIIHLKSLLVDWLCSIAHRCECVCTRAWCPLRDWHSIQDVFPPHTQSSHDRLQIDQNPDQDKIVIEDEWMNGFTFTFLTQSPTAFGIQWTFYKPLYTSASCPEIFSHKRCPVWTHLLNTSNLHVKLQRGRKWAVQHTWHKVPGYLRNMPLIN